MAYWLNTVCLDHTVVGVREGIVQADHGSPRRLSHLSRGDWIAIYSPRRTMHGHEPVRCFTAIGTVADDECYQVRLRADFAPWRRDVDWLPGVRHAPVRDLLGRLSFTQGRTNWGLAFRRGLFEIQARDWLHIAAAMGHPVPSPDADAND